MEEIEKSLRGLPLRRPSAGLDQRIAVLLAAGDRRPPVRWRARLLAGAAYLLCGVAGFVAGRVSAPEPAAVPAGGHAVVTRVELVPSSRTVAGAFDLTRLEDPERARWRTEVQVGEQKE
jgi:hypothetical protein